MRGFRGLVIFALLLVLLSVGQSVGFYTDWLWFQEVGYTRIFTTALSVKLMLAVLSGGIFSLLVYVNVKIAAQTLRGLRFLELDNTIELPSPELIDPLLRRLLLPACLLLGLLAGPQGAGQWESLLLFFNSVPFGIADPLFGRDIGFYVFQLPMLAGLYHWLTILLMLTFAATASTYVLYRGIQYGRHGLALSRRARIHLLALAAIILLVDRKSTRLNSSHIQKSRMPSSA